MITGFCPYCDGVMDFEVPEELFTPVFWRVECDHCGKDFMEYISRMIPCAYRLEDVELDDKGKVINVKEKV